MGVASSILIVDDEAALRQSLSLVLRSDGYKVTTASTADEASRLLEAGAFDLVFLDLKMPGKDGLVMLKELRSMYPHMPVLILTAHATLEFAMEAVRLGARDYLLKPIDPENILTRAREVIEESQQPARMHKVVSQIQELIDELNTEDQSNNTKVDKPGLKPENPARFLRRGNLNPGFVYSAGDDGWKGSCPATIDLRFPGYPGASLAQPGFVRAASS